MGVSCPYKHNERAGNPMTTTDYSLDTYRLLAAFHSGMMLRRTPTPATPDGHRKFFTLDQLVAEHRIADGSDLCELAREAKRMARKGLLAHRRLYGRDYWMVTPAGSHALRMETKRNGLSQLLGTGMDIEQAEYEARRAAAAARSARIMFEQAAAEFGTLLPTEDALLYAVLHGRAAQ